LKVNKISSKEKMENQNPEQIANRQRIWRRVSKIRQRPYYYKNHKVKRKVQIRPNERAGFRQRRRRFHRRVHPGWRKVTKELRVSADLQAVIGRPRASRGQIVSLIWRYVRDHRLQNTGNGRLFYPDETLARVVGIQGQLMDGFRMMSYLNAHIMKEN
jgi:chromatin remodeling complex protein RSC6